jgi:hypothetical protein
MACGDARARTAMAAGGRIGFEFADKFDQQLLRVTVIGNDCG